MYITNLTNLCKTEIFSFGSYNIQSNSYINLNKEYTPPKGYSIACYTINYPPRYTGGIKYENNHFSGSIYNFTNGNGTYDISAMILLICNA